MIIPDRSKISISVESELEYFNVFGDGNKIGSYAQEVEMKLERAEYHVYLVQTRGHEFYKIIREKLGWGENFRDKKRFQE